jgi:CheY-like chemotaxis protein
MILALPEAVWPLIAVVVLVTALAFIFRRTIEDTLLPRVSGVKVLGIEISFAKEELDRASSRPRLTKAGMAPSKGDRHAALERAREAAPLLQGAEVLWLDDHPSRNRSERRMLQAFGVMIDVVTTNSEALAMLRQHRYDLLISDIERNGDHDAGPAFAREIAHPNPLAKPVIFYVGTLDRDAGTPAHAFAITNRPDHLLHYVIDVLARWRRDAARGLHPQPSE